MCITERFLWNPSYTYWLYCCVCILRVYHNCKVLNTVSPMIVRIREVYQVSLVGFYILNASESRMYQANLMYFCDREVYSSRSSISFVHLAEACRQQGVHPDPWSSTEFYILKFIVGQGIDSTVIRYLCCAQLFFSKINSSYWHTLSARLIVPGDMSNTVYGRCPAQVSFGCTFFRIFISLVHV